MVVVRAFHLGDQSSNPADIKIIFYVKMTKINEAGVGPLLNTNVNLARFQNFYILRYRRVHYVTFKMGTHVVHGEKALSTKRLPQNRLKIILNSGPCHEPSTLRFRVERADHHQ